MRIKGKTKLMSLLLLFLLVFLIVFVFQGCAGSRNTLTKRERKLKSGSPSQNSAKEKIFKVNYQKRLFPEDTSPTVFPCRKFVLKGSYDQENYNEKYIALKRNFHTYPYEGLYLLRIADGKLSQVLDKPVNYKYKFNLLNFKIGDNWACWEEVSPGDDLRYPVSWAYYVAKIDHKKMKLGKPVLVAKGHTSREARALPGFVDDKLFLMLNYYDLKTKKFWGKIMMYDPEKKEKKVIHKTSRNYEVLRSFNGNAIFTEFLIPKKGNVALHVYSPAEGKEILTIDLNNKNDISHFPYYQNGYVAWSMFNGTQSQLTSVYVYDLKKRKLYEIVNSIDPVFAGKYVFLRRDRVKLALYGHREQWEEIAVFDLETGKMFPLVRTNGSAQFVLTGYPNGLYNFAVITHDYFENSADNKLEVLIYDLKGKTPK